MKTTGIPALLGGKIERKSSDGQILRMEAQLPRNCLGTRCVLPLPGLTVHRFRPVAQPQVHLPRNEQIQTKHKKKIK